jgi:transposase
VLDQRAHGAAEGEGAQRPEGFGQGAQELEEQRNADLLDLFGRDGHLDEHRRGSADGEAFLLYVERLLCPALKPGQTFVVMDNLQVHKMKKVRELIEGCGCQLVFLPSYSPDFNPIEEAFSKVKTLLRKAKARSFEALVEASGRALSAVTKEDARGLFSHCGYGTSQALSL